MEKTNLDKTLELISKLLKKLQSLNQPLSTYLPQWKDRTIRMLENLVVDAELDLFADINEDTWEKETISCQQFLIDLMEGIAENPEFFLIENDVFNSGTETIKPRNKTKKSISNRVFIVHGHDSQLKTEVARTLEQLGLEAIILHEQPNEGKTIIEKFERDASQVSFSVVILTPDDIGYPKNKEKDAKPRARQNVVLELGYFSGILGRSNVCVLYKGGVEIPSDYLGVIYIPIDEDNAWKYKLSKELKQAGLEIDLNKLI